MSTYKCLFLQCLAVSSECNSTGCREKVIVQLQELFYTASLVHSTKCKALVFPTSSHQQQRRSAESRRSSSTAQSWLLHFEPSFTLLEFKVYTGSTVVVVLWCSGAVCSGAVQWWVSERGKCSCISGALPVATV